MPGPFSGLRPYATWTLDGGRGLSLNVASLWARNPQFSWPGNMLSVVSSIGEAWPSCLVWGVGEAVQYLTTSLTPPHCRCSLPEVSVLPIPEFWRFRSALWLELILCFLCLLLGICFLLSIFFPTTLSPASGISLLLVFSPLLVHRGFCLSFKKTLFSGISGLTKIDALALYLEVTVLQFINDWMNRIFFKWKFYPPPLYFLKSIVENIK